MVSLDLLRGQSNGREITQQEHSNQRDTDTITMVDQEREITEEEMALSPSPSALPFPTNASHWLNLTESQRVSKPVHAVHRDQHLGAQRKAEKDGAWVLGGQTEEPTHLLIAVLYFNGPHFEFIQFVCFPGAQELLKGIYSLGERKNNRH